MTLPPILRYCGPWPSQRHLSSVRGLSFQRFASSVWFIQVASIFAAFRCGHWGRDRTNALVAAAIKAKPQTRAGPCRWEAFERLRRKLQHAFDAPESSYQALTATEVISRNLAWPQMAGPRQARAPGAAARHQRKAEKSGFTLHLAGALSGHAASRRESSHPGASPPPYILFMYMF